MQYQTATGNAMQCPPKHSACGFFLAFKCDTLFCKTDYASRTLKITTIAAPAAANLNLKRGRKRLPVVSFFTLLRPGPVFTE